MAYYVYIIKSKRDDTYYVGQTNNLEDRIRRHNLGYSKATKAKKPWELVCEKEFASRSQAVRYERNLKRKKNRKSIEWLIGVWRSLV